MHGRLIVRKLFSAGFQDRIDNDIAIGTLKAEWEINSQPYTDRLYNVQSQGR